MPLSELGAASTALVGVGAALSAALASACCVGPIAAPLVVAVLGAGGAAWAAGLKPYSWIILAGSGLLLGYSFWSLYSSRGAACRAREEHGSARLGTRALTFVVWSAAVIWFVSLGFNLFLPGS